MNENMKVFFDGEIFSLQGQGGISRIFFELIRSFAQSQHVEQILYRGPYIDSYPFKKEWFKHSYGIRWPVKRGMRFIRSIDNQFMELAYTINANSTTIYHSTYYRVPRHHRGPVVVHAYDMIHELYGGYSKTKDKKEKAFKAADLIIAISESTKSDIMRILNISESKVVVIYLAASSFFKPMTKKDNISARNRYELHKPFLLYIGKRSGHKNFKVLVDAYSKWKSKDDFDLVCVGGEKQWSQEELLMMESSRLSESVKLIPSCSDEQLRCFYSSAYAFIYPSLYEGFGIPPLESMACGTPVVVSNTSSLPEVVGDAGLYFNPESTEELISVLNKITGDEELHASLVIKGEERSRRFSWDKTAYKTYSVYQRFQ